MGGNVTGKRNAEERLPEFCKKICLANGGFIRNKKRKITYGADGCETEIDFVLVREKYRKYITDMKVIPWELQHSTIWIKRF